MTMKRLAFLSTLKNLMLDHPPCNKQFFQIKRNLLELKVYQLTCNDHPGSVTDLSLAISGDARVVTDVLMPDVGDSQLCPVVEDANCS